MPRAPDWWVFRLSDAEWDNIGDYLEEATGRLKYDGDRWSLEFACNCFVVPRQKRGRSLPTPAKAAKAWHKIADQAQKLHDAIEGLREAGAADFTMLDNHQGHAAAWAASLPSLVQGARDAAALELYAPKTANNSDPGRDFFVLRLVRLWKGYGGRVAAGYDDAAGKADGPLVRFLQMVTAPAMKAAGEAAISPDALRALIRRVVAEDMVSSTPK